jgi:uncharacterized protein (DUF302 family)
MQAWKEKLEKASSLLSKAWDFAYRYRVEFDKDIKGKACKVVVYQEKDGAVFMALTKEAYEKAIELAESEDKSLKESARAVLNYVERFSESFEIWKVRKILQEAKNFSRTRIEDGKIKTSVDGVVYEMAEERVKELAQADSPFSKDIQKYYEEVLKNVEKERKRDLKRRLWEEIEKSWVRRTLVGNLLYPVGIGRGEGRGGFYYTVDMEILPEDLKEEIKKYAIFLRDTRGIQDIDSWASPGLVKPTRLPPGWYIPEARVDAVRELLRKKAQELATEEDKVLVEQYKKLEKEV